jgi:CoA:oxalate CoA-transferase
MADHNDIFAGVRVIEIGQYIAAPLAARLMSDMGAEVFKVELPPYGDMMRVYAIPGVTSGELYIADNRGKKSVCVDLKRPEGAQAVRDLAARSDVLIENYTPGVMSKYGVSYEILQPINPRLIMCSISGFGQTGPLANKPGNDLMAQAASGIMNLIGYPDRPPVYPGSNLADNGAGIHALAAIASALYFREKTGRGQYIDLALNECLGHYNALGMVQHGVSRGTATTTRSGSHSGGTAPFGVFKARDGYVAIAVLINQWTIFAELIGQPEIATDPRYDTIEHRVQHKDEVIKIVEDWLQSFPSRNEPIAMLEKAHIMCTPVLDTPGFMNDPQVRARGLMQAVEQPGVGALDLARAPFHFSDARVEIRMRAPLLGEHNESALAAVAGYSAEKIAELNQSGVLKHDPRVDQLRAGSELK